MELNDVKLYLETNESSNTRFKKVLNSCFPKPAAATATVPATHIYWGAATFGLDTVDVFQRLGVELRDAVLKVVNEESMRESCFIEMAGLSYTARMGLESNCLDERLFYAMMASEEATHYQMLRPFVPTSVLDRGPDEFTQLIGEMITSADREQVIFLIQVLLEGWGLTHFSALAADCQNHDLRNVFKAILKDEARHHAAGSALLKGTIDTTDRVVCSWLEQILAMVAAGPVRVMRALEEISGETSHRPQILVEMNAFSTTQEKLLQIKTLIKDHVHPKLMAMLEEKSLFVPSF